MLPREAVRKLPTMPSQSDKFKYEMRGMSKKEKNFNFNLSVYIQYGLCV